METSFQQIFDIDLHLDPLWCAWFTGWIDGEGCFRAVVHHDNLGVAPLLQVSVRNDDSKMIYQVRETLNQGKVYSSSAESARRKGIKENDSIRWICAHIGACRHVLVPLFDKYPLHSKKSRDYEIWREIVILVSEGNHRNANREHVLDLCRKLSEIKRYHPVTPETLLLSERVKSNFGGRVSG